jgi:predicted DNA-binding transcriptional regulator YafY
MRADRLLSILLLLQTRGRITATKLAEMLEVSERTIYRDLDALSAAGIPVYAERGPGGGCTLMEGYRTNLTGLTETEIRSLFVGGVAGPLSDLGLGHVLEDALLKLLAALPSDHRHDAERVRQRIILDAAGWFRGEEPVPYLHVLQEAVWQDRLLHMRYRRSDNQHIERTVEPYGLVAKASIWYMVGAAAGELRTYRVSRVLAAELLAEHFERPADFDLTTYWADWCAAFETSRSQYPIRVRIAPELLSIMPRVFGEGVYTLVEQAPPPDDQGWITLPFHFESLEQAGGFVLGFGALMETLDPPELREYVIAVAKNVVRFYEALG